MSRTRERLVVGALLVGGPTLFYLGVGRGQVDRIDRLRAERMKVEGEFAGPMPYVPVSREERQALSNPLAPWRGRIPVLSDERARLAHYHWVVSAFQAASREGGAPVVALRSSWDPIRASFSLPERLPGAAPEGGGALDQPEYTLSGWVLEARYAGGTDRVFRGLQASGHVAPLLEPVALRWEASPGGVVTHLGLRNLYLVP